MTWISSPLLVVVLLALAVAGTTQAELLLKYDHVTLFKGNTGVVTSSVTSGSKELFVGGSVAEGADLNAGSQNKRGSANVFPGRLFLTKFDKSAGTRGPWIFYIEPDVTADSVYLYNMVACANSNDVVIVGTFTGARATVIDANDNHVNVNAAKASDGVSDDVNIFVVRVSSDGTAVWAKAFSMGFIDAHLRGVYPLGLSVTSRLSVSDVDREGTDWIYVATSYSTNLNIDDNPEHSMGEVEGLTFVPVILRIDPTTGEVAQHLILIPSKPSPPTSAPSASGGDGTEPIPSAVGPSTEPIPSAVEPSTEPSPSATEPIPSAVEPSTEPSPSAVEPSTEPSPSAVEPSTEPSPSAVEPSTEPSPSATEPIPSAPAPTLVVTKPPTNSNGPRAARGDDVETVPAIAYFANTVLTALEFDFTLGETSSLIVAGYNLAADSSYNIVLGKIPIAEDGLLPNDLAFEGWDPIVIDVGRQPIYPALASDKHEEISDIIITSVFQLTVEFNGAVAPIVCHEDDGQCIFVVSLDLTSGTLKWASVIERTGRFVENFDRIAPVAAITEESGSYVLVSGPSSPDTRINLEDGDGNSVLVIDKWRESRSFLAVLDLQDGTPLFLKEMVQTGNMGSIQMMTVLPNKEALTILVGGYVNGSDLYFDTVQTGTTSVPTGFFATLHVVDSSEVGSGPVPTDPSHLNTGGDYSVAVEAVVVVIVLLVCVFLCWRFAGFNIVMKLVRMCCGGGRTRYRRLQHQDDENLFALDEDHVDDLL